MQTTYSKYTARFGEKNLLDKYYIALYCVVTPSS